MRSGRSCAAAMMLAMGLAGCQSGATGPGPIKQGATVVNPFAPASIRVHPLTHLTTSHEGNPIIVMHVELRDAWGETCKGVGSAVVELYRPSFGPGSGLEVQELVWEVDLADLDRNARLYDPATRTYRLQLANLPPWLKADPSGAERRVRLNVTLTAPDARGDQILLEDGYVLRY